MILADDLDSRFRRLGTSGSEVNAASFSKIWRSHREEASREFFCRRGVKLRSVRKRESRGLLGHRTADFGNAVADVDDRGLACCIEKFTSIRGKKPASFATDGHWDRLVKIARKKSGIV